AICERPPMHAGSRGVLKWRDSLRFTHIKEVSAPRANAGRAIEAFVCKRGCAPIFRRCLMSKRWILMLFLTLAAANAQQKGRVAVMDFDYATVQSNVSALFGSNQDVGKGVADILVDKLVSAGAYSVIERKQIDKVLAEQH